MSQKVTWYDAYIERYLVKDYLNEKGFLPGEFVVMSTSDPMETRVIIVYATEEGEK